MSDISDKKWLGFLKVELQKHPLRHIVKYLDTAHTFEEFHLDLLFVLEDILKQFKIHNLQVKNIALLACIEVLQQQLESILYKDGFSRHITLEEFKKEFYPEKQSQS